MKLKYTNIIQIIVISLLIAVTYNYFNVDGVNLLQGKIEYATANDSLINALTADSLQSFTKIDSVDQLLKNDSSKQQENIKPTNSAKVEITNSIEKENNLQEESDSQSEFSELHSISLEQAYKLYSNNILFIDARNKSDYDYSHILNAVSLPVFQFEDYKTILEKIEVNQPIVVYCNGPDCDMSEMLANKLYELGYHKLFVFTGGWEEWEKAKYPSEPVR